ncbi:extracellular solute-binding protein [Paraburkholderia sp. J41]|uniref:extracellular solute-binding protein n=1 Tax=Paraburkholderia sp. J41 TaxID=2805433 RepID=UPI002AC328FD|nr:extracellular solute-binding protein [Paraburkholderia sp. J41]
MLAALSCLLAVPAAHAADTEIVLATWGGSWGAAIDRNAIKPFEQETGIKVRVISGVSLANMRMVASQRAHPQIDLIMSTSQDEVRAYNDGLLDAIDVKDVPNLAAIPPFGVRRDGKGRAMGAGMWVYPYGIAYRTDQKLPDVKCWNDLWGPAFKDKVGVSSPRYMNGYFLLMINRIAGGTEANVQPGLNRIHQMGANLLAVIDDSAAQQRLLASGEVSAVPIISSAAYKLVDSGAPVRFVIPCEGAPAGLDTLSLVKNAPHRDAALKFMDFYTSAKIIGSVAAELQIQPVNDQVTVSDAQRKYTLTKDQMAKLVSFDDQSVIRNQDAWTAAWDREIAPMTKR